jgi:2-iminoacetate synthase
MSAGSHTEPGGYTGQGRSDLHLTVRGRRQEAELPDRAHALATSQFEIADHRSPLEISTRLRDHHGLEPVWKDWDVGL